MSAPGTQLRRFRHHWSQWPTLGAPKSLRATISPADLSFPECTSGGLRLETSSPTGLMFCFGSPGCSGQPDPLEAGFPMNGAGVGTITQRSGLRVWMEKASLASLLSDLSLKTCSHVTGFQCCVRPGVLESVGSWQALPLVVLCPFSGVPPCTLVGCAQQRI